jgi:hypothetical protein
MPMVVGSTDNELVGFSYSFQQHDGPGADSAYNKPEYQ